MWWAIGAAAAILALIWLVLALMRANRVVDGAFEMLDEVESTKKDADSAAGTEGGATDGGAAPGAGEKRLSS